MRRIDFAPGIERYRRELSLRPGQNRDWRIGKVLGRAATGAVPEDMRAAAILGDVRDIFYEHREGTAWFSETRIAQPWAMDCSRVRRLAHQELLRRGLIA